MRPRRYAADNISKAARNAQIELASMRPRRYAADNPLYIIDCETDPFASMRPRRYAADNGWGGRVTARRGSSFNEAAALRRG